MHQKFNSPLSLPLVIHFLLTFGTPCPPNLIFLLFPLFFFSLRGLQWRQWLKDVSDATQRRNFEIKIKESTDQWITLSINLQAEVTMDSHLLHSSPCIGYSFKRAQFLSIYKFPLGHIWFQISEIYFKSFSLLGLKTCLNSCMPLPLAFSRSSFFQPSQRLIEEMTISSF